MHKSNREAESNKACQATIDLRTQQFRLRLSLSLLYTGFIYWFGAALKMYFENKGNLSPSRKGS